MSDPTARVTALGDNFRKQMAALARWLYKHYRTGTGQDEKPQWYAPDKGDWSGSPFDLEGMAKPFLRDQHIQEFDAAVSDPAHPGTTGDLTLSQLQGDLLAMLERAYRSRMRTSVRNKVHAFAHSYGQGHEQGVIQLSQIGYLEQVMKQSNQSPS